MEITWLHGLLYGLMCGYSQFLPVSSEAHRVLFLQLTGLQEEGGLMRLSVRLAALLALVICCWPQISRMRREKRVASIPPRRRKRQPDKKILLDMKLTRTAMIPLLLSLIALSTAQQVIGIRFWLVAIMLVINGIILYYPQFLPGANKDALSLSAWDSVLMGLGGALGVVPGFSRVGIFTSVGMARGADRKYILEIALLLCIPITLALCLLDFFSIAFAASAVSGDMLLSCAIAAGAAFFSTFGAIYLMRFMIVNAGFAGFAYYSWGMALIIFILYLTV